MKCPKCGAEVPERTKFCPQCGAPLAAVAAAEPETAEPKAADQPAPEPAEPAAPVGEAPKKERKPLIKPETQAKIRSNIGQAFAYIGKSLIFPGTALPAVSTTVSLIVDAVFLVINTVWLYLLQRTLVGWIAAGFPGFPKGMFKLMPTNMTFRMDFFTTLLGGIELTLGLLAVITVMEMAAKARKKEPLNFFTCLKAATHQLILPEVLLVIAALAGTISFAAGAWSLIAVLIIWFMNIVLMFRDSYNWVSYLAVIVGMLAIMLLAYSVFGQCWVQVRGISTGL